MHQKHRILIAGGVVAAGLLVALLFRKPPTVDDPLPVASTGQGAVDPRAAGQPAERPQFLAESGGAEPLRAFVADPGAAAVAAPPVLAAQPTGDEQAAGEFRPPFQGGDSNPPQIELRHPGDERDPFADHPFDAGEVPSQPEKPRRKHRVRDGDTLRTLARRYLGDAARANDILEANRERLDDPEVLPIGAELEIPPAMAADSVP